jgi:hypothetical protein
VVGILFWGREVDLRMLDQGVRTLNDQRLAYGIGTRTGYLTEYICTTPADLLSFLPLGMAYFLLSPFPWQIGSTVSPLILVEVLPWYTLLPVAGIGFVRLVKDDTRPRPRVVLILFLVVPLVLYSLVSGNVGTALRHRAQIMPFIAMLAALGYTVKRPQENAGEQAVPPPSLRREEGAQGFEAPMVATHVPVGDGEGSLS